MSNLRSGSLSGFRFGLNALVIALGLMMTGGFAQAEEFSNFMGMKFVDVPTGSFKMGSCKAAMPDQAGVKVDCIGAELDVPFNELPQHGVTVAGFQMGKTEVTLGQFKDYIIKADRSDLVSDEFMEANSQANEAPVVYVSWNDIKTFVEWLNKTKPATDQGVYRLPFEAEWEYACRAGSHDAFCGSKSPSAVAWHGGNSGSHQQGVGRKDANAFALHDMSGNVREWVEDCYHDSFVNAPVDGSAWTTKCTSPERVLRGGSWKDESFKVRASNRINAPSVSRSNTIGFRLVRKVP